MAQQMDKDLKKVFYGDDADKDVQDRARRKRILFIILIFFLVFAVLASAYYLIDLLVIENSYKIYVGNAYGSSQAVGLKLSYDEDGDGGYSDISGRGIRLQDATMSGIGFSGSAVGNRSSLETYLFDVASGSVDTEVSDNGRVGGANADELVASKFYLKNGTDYGVNESGNVKYGIRVEIDKNVNNVFAAARIAVIRVKDASAIWENSSDNSSFTATGLNNEAFEMTVFAQPKTGYDGTETDVDTREPVACTGADIDGNRYQTDNPNATLVTDPNSDDPDAVFYCTNLTKEDGMWVYDSASVGQYYYLPYGSTDSYVVASWFEGSDPDHNESISGGYMTFTTYFMSYGTY